MRSFILSVGAAVAVAVSACGETRDSSEVSIDASVVKYSALASAVTATQSNGGANIAEQLSRHRKYRRWCAHPRTKGASRAQMKGGSSIVLVPDSGRETCTFSSCKIGSATASGTIVGRRQTVCTNLTFDVAAIGQTGRGQSVRIGATHRGDLRLHLRHGHARRLAPRHGSTEGERRGLPLGRRAHGERRDLDVEGVHGTVDVGATVTTVPPTPGAPTRSTPRAR